jgi:hypothetical protein
MMLGPCESLLFLQEDIVIQRVLFIALTLAFGLALSNCAPAPAAPTPAAPGSVATVPAPAAAQIRLALPPQPTSPPPPTGVPSPYQTSVPALIVSGPTLVPTAIPTVAAATKAPATAQPTATKSASTAPAAQGVATGKRTDVKFTFDPALSTIEEAEPLDVALTKVPGIFESSSSQTSAIVTYDAGLITVDQIQQFFALQGHPVKLQ